MTPQREGQNILTNVDVVVYALMSLGGASKAIHSEDIAAKAFELSPSRFSWRLPVYQKRKWPDKYIVKTALEDAKKEELGGLVDGVYALDVSKDGWHSTPSGVQWFKANKSRIETFLKRTSSPIAPNVANRFIKQITTQILYQSFKKDNNLENVSIYILADFLNCSGDSPSEVMWKKLSVLRSTAEMVQEGNIILFLTAFHNRLGQLISPENRG